MSKYSELADRLLRWPSVYTIGTGLHEDLAEAAAALRELEAENDKLNALRLLPLHSEIKVLRARVAELEAENRMYSESMANATQDIERLREAFLRIADTDPDDGTDWFHSVARAVLEGK